MANEPNAWMGKPILHSKDVEGLDREAAVNEFVHKQPRNVAEENAYRTYVKNHHVEAAAHHMAHSKAARGAGDMEAARKHGRLYEMHIKAMGHSPYGPVPPEVALAHSKKQEKGTVVQFKPHEGDQYLLDGSKSLK